MQLQVDPGFITGKYPWSQYLQAGKGYVQIHIPFPHPGSACATGRSWEGVCISHYCTAFVRSFFFSISVSCCSLTAVVLSVLTEADWADIFLSTSPERAWNCSPALFLRRSKSFLSNKNSYPAFFQGSQKLMWQYASATHSDTKKLCPHANTRQRVL